VAFAVGRADLDHQLGHRRGAAAGARLAPAQVFAQRVGVQVFGARPGYSFRLKVDRRSGHGQGANLLAADGPVLVALAHQHAAVGQAMQLQAARHADADEAPAGQLHGLELRRHGRPAQRRCLAQRQLRLLLPHLARRSAVAVNAQHD
jgi:hypothetical protein